MIGLCNAPAAQQGLGVLIQQILVAKFMGG